MDIADWARDPEILFDAPQEESTAPLISHGMTRLRKIIQNTLEYHTGDREQYLSKEECFDLASQKEAGVIAAETLSKIESTQKWVTKPRREKLEQQIEMGKAARTKLIEGNLTYAAYLARASMNIVPEAKRQEIEKGGKRLGAFSDITKLASSTASIEDRTQTAFLALVKAVDKFKPGLDRKGRPSSFLGFAEWYIHAELYRFVLGDELNGVRLPSNVGQDILDASKNPDKFSSEILEQMKFWKNGQFAIGLSEINHGITAQEEQEDEYSTTSLDLSEIIADPIVTDVEVNASKALLAKIVKKTLATLDPREADTIKLRFGIDGDDPSTLDEIGLVLGVTRERVRQIEDKALSKVRHPFRSRPLKDFLNTEASEEVIYRNSLHSPPSSMIGSLIGKTAIGDALQDLLHNQSYIQSASVSHPIDPRDEWDIPLRRSSLELMDQYEKAGRKFTRILNSAEPSHFTKEQADKEEGSFYPSELLDIINKECGEYLQAHHIEEFWNSSINRLVNKIQRTEEGVFVIDRLSLLFSHLLAERMTDNDKITLQIPQSLLGKLHMFGANLRYGELIVDGDLGDFAGYQMSGIANLQVNGNVGDYAASDMNGLAAFSVNGDAGNELGYGSSDGTIEVKGFVKSLALRPTFKGFVKVGRAGDISLLTSDPNTYEILSDRK